MNWIVADWPWEIDFAVGKNRENSYTDLFCRKSCFNRKNGDMGSFAAGAPPE